MKYKHLLTTLLLAFLGYLPSQAQLTGATFAEAKSSKTAKWTYTYIETPGFASKQANGQVEGLVVDIMKRFAEYVEKQEGIKVSYEFKAKNPNDFGVFLQEVKTGQGGVFGLGNITITEARKREYTFSPAFIKNISIICTHKDAPNLSALKDISKSFAGMRAIVVDGTTNEQVIRDLKKKHWPELQIQKFSSSPEALEAVINDKKSFTNLDFTYYLAALQQNKPIKRHPAGDQSTEEFGIIMPKSNDWNPLMEKFFTQFIGSSEYRKIIANHLGTTGLRLLDSVAN
jgi:ABC-type amino acid transport substrate-binding protein